LLRFSIHLLSNYLSLNIQICLKLNSTLAALSSSNITFSFPNFIGNSPKG